MTNLHSPAPYEDYSVSGLFDTSSRADGCERIGTLGVERVAMRIDANLETRFDIFSRTNAACCFLRFTPGPTREIRITLSGNYGLAACPSGGWLLLPSSGDREAYWLPQSPKLRRLDDHGHVLEEHAAELTGITVSFDELALQLRIPDSWVLDWKIWRIPQDTWQLIDELRDLLPIETQRYFLWSSHTTYQRPADVYLHLIHGHVYENRITWPKYWTICSENDAHALHTVLSGLERSTGKRLYRMLKDQLLVSVISRQGQDGGWRHGEWTDRMESHYRLHCSAMHMLMDALEEQDDPALEESLRKAAAFISRQHDKLTAGAWFLHDDLEHSAEGMNQSSFRWYPSRVLGKSESNMLVLNTQLDTIIALHRYGKVTDDNQYVPLLESARRATDAVLGLKTADWLYRVLFRAIGLTLLPTPVAKRLPLPLRALKRVAWKHLIPLLPRIKTAFPRLVMPGGYIDRALSVGTLSHAYLSVNAMDLARYRRQFGGTDIELLIAGAIEFVSDKALLERWQEDSETKYALGFWAEALYHLCTIDRLPQYRSMLAETILALESQNLGIPPSLLGENPEAVAGRLPCPSPRDRRIRIANLSRDGRMELLAVNPGHESIGLNWETPPTRILHWSGSAIAPPDDSYFPRVPARGWLWGREGT